MHTKRLVCVLTLLMLCGTASVHAQAGDEQPTEPSWWDWKLQIDEFLAPVFQAQIDARSALADAQDQACGNVLETFVPGANPLDTPTLSDDPTSAEMAWALGQSLGQPIGYIRALQKSNSIQLSFVDLIFNLALAGIAWLVFVIGIALLIRTIRAVVGFARDVIELIPGE